MRSTQRKPAPSLAGYTLLEMLVVVAIIGIAASIAVPNMTPAVNKAKIAQEAERVATFLEDARGRARADRRCYLVAVKNANTLEMSRKLDGNCVSDFANVETIEQLGLDEKTTLQIETTGPVAGAVVFMTSGRPFQNTVGVVNRGARLSVGKLDTDELESWEKSVDITSRGRICINTHVGGTPTLAALKPTCASGNNALGRLPAGWAGLGLLAGLALLGARRRRRAKRTPARHPRSARGYILLEVLIAAGLISVGLAAVIASLAQARTDITLASNRTAAVQSAHQKLDELMSTAQLLTAGSDNPEPGITRNWSVTRPNLHLASTPPLTDTVLGTAAQDILLMISVDVTYQHTETLQRTYNISAIKRSKE